METNSKIKLCKASELKSGESKGIILNGKDIGVFNINGTFYAIENACLHAGAPLSDGFIDEKKCQVACNWHGWVFDIATGKCVSHPKQDLFTKTYPITIEDNDIFIEI